MQCAPPLFGGWSTRLMGISAATSMPSHRYERCTPLLLTRSSNHIKHPRWAGITMYSHAVATFPSHIRHAIALHQNLHFTIALEIDNGEPCRDVDDVTASDSHWTNVLTPHSASPAHGGTAWPLRPSAAAGWTHAPQGRQLTKCVPRKFLNKRAKGCHQMAGSRTGPSATFPTTSNRAPPALRMGAQHLCKHV